MLAKIRTFFDLIRFEHTIFALPFAYIGMIVAQKAWPGAEKFFLITLAMVSARTAGMTLNRIIDVEIDRKNPRTQNRPSVTGKISIKTACIAAAVSLGIFFLTAWLLNPLCFRLSAIALFLLVAYHYVKRFSFLCHFTLGLVLAIAPMGGWLGVTGVFAWPSIFLALAVLFWVAGFDILYSLQDADFDRSHKLHSVPVQFGENKALEISRYSHMATILFFVLFGFFAHLGLIYWVGVALTGALLYTEHYLLREGDLTYLNTAFFTINGWVGVLLFVFTFLEIFR